MLFGVLARQLRCWAKFGKRDPL